MHILHTPSRSRKTLKFDRSPHNTETNAPISTKLINILSYQHNGGPYNKSNMADGRYLEQVAQLSLTNPRDALHHDKRQNFTTVT